MVLRFVNLYSVGSKMSSTCCSMQKTHDDCLNRQNKYPNCHHKIKLSWGHFGKNEFVMGTFNGGVWWSGICCKGLRWQGFGVGWVTGIWGRSCGWGVGFSAFAGGYIFVFLPEIAQYIIFFTVVLRNVCG